MNKERGRLNPALFLFGMQVRTASGSERVVTPGRGRVFARHTRSLPLAVLILTARS
jgi:hypothetical protein